mmetsp:Transcript_12359/g.12407  ORF Transcript_12359/g.12407 Transcript_12359/m.12407 type:complete len:146 (-) Transcript_12359:35-472(-)
MLVDLLEDHVSEFDQSSVVHKILDSKFVQEIITFIESYRWSSTAEAPDGMISSRGSSAAFGVMSRPQMAFKDSYFLSAFQAAFSSFLNRSVRTHTIAEVLGRSVDKVLRKGNQDHTEVQINEYIEAITNIFTYMEDKDIFIEVYR